jgi:hypothetical protein
MVHHDRHCLQTGSQDRDQQTYQHQPQTSPAEESPRGYASGIRNGQNGCVWPAALHRILRAGAVATRRINPTCPQRLCYARPVRRHHRAASRASPARPIPPSKMPSRTKTNLLRGRSATGMTTTAPARVRMCACAVSWVRITTGTAAHDNGSLWIKPVPWHGAGADTSLVPGCFIRVVPAHKRGWIVRQSFLGPFGGPGDWESSMPAYFA